MVHAIKRQEKKVIFIAEIGENHMGDMGLARRLIKQAAEAGADFVKFQSYRPENFKRDDPEYEWFKKVSLSDEDHFMLKRYAQRQNIEFMSSPFSLERAKFLCEELKLKKIKVASGKMIDKGLLTYLNKNCKEVFLSTGMATINEIKSALSLLDKVKVYLLHCVTQYPLQNQDANLLAISTLKKCFPSLTVGYSDHTIGNLALLVAVSLGAQVVEKHVTLDNALKEGTDHILSVTPLELKKIIKDIKTVKDLLGDGEKIPRACEKRIKEFVRNRFI